MRPGPAQQLVTSLAQREQSAVEAVESAIARIEAGDAEINAVVVRDFDRARAQAAKADEHLARGDRAPLLGLPMTVKESINVAGLPTTWGLKEHAEFIAERDAEVVARLRSAGAIILGKTNVPPFLADLQASNPVYGVTHNPHRRGMSPGGSSGGSAAALAAGFVLAEVGSDIAGSIRTPAAFCGVWGLKPTYGVVPQAGHSYPGTDGADPHLAVVGPLARDVGDLDLLLGVLAQHPLSPPRRESLRALRVAVVTDHPLTHCSADVTRALHSQAARLEERGAFVDLDPQLPELEEMHHEYLRLLNTVMFRGLPPAGREPLTLVQWFDMLDLHARTGRVWDEMFRQRYDVVLAPILGTTAFPIDEANLPTRTLDIDGSEVPFAPQLAWAGLATYPGLPAVAFPSGLSEDGMPIGLQLIGPRFGDRQVMRIAELLTAH